MCLRFVFLLITRMTSWLRLSGREEAWQTAEILLHQLAVLQWQQPRLGLLQDPRWPGSENSGVGGVGSPEECRDRPGGQGQPGHCSCDLRPRRSWRAAYSRPASWT